MRVPRAVRLTNGPYTLRKHWALPPAPIRPLLRENEAAGFFFLGIFKKAPRAVPRKRSGGREATAELRCGAKWAPRHRHKWQRPLVGSSDVLGGRVAVACALLAQLVAGDESDGN